MRSSFICKKIFLYKQWEVHYIVFVEVVRISSITRKEGVLVMLSYTVDAEYDAVVDEYHLWTDDGRDRIIKGDDAARFELDIAAGMGDGLDFDSAMILAARSWL